jgi:hypothetical protein
MYSVIESVATPGCVVPTHSHRNEDEHLLVISGRYRIAAEFGYDILGPPVADQSPAGSYLVDGGEAGMTAKDA